MSWLAVVIGAAWLAVAVAAVVSLVVRFVWRRRRAAERFAAEVRRVYPFSRLGDPGARGSR